MRTPAYPLLSRIKSCLVCLLLSGPVFTTFGQLPGQSIVFPPDAGIIDVSKAPYFATPDDATDDTEAIQTAFNDHPSGNRIIYFPKGTYLISKPLHFPYPFKRTILQGESEAQTVIRLQDRCPGFTNPDSPLYMLRTARLGFSADAFRNAIRNLTMDAGAANPGAIALQFFGSNQCRIEQVTLRAATGSGAIGLDLGYTPDNGPGLIRHLTVEGFDTGVSLDFKVNSFTFEHLTLKNQRVQGLYNARQVCTIRGLRSENSVPALVNTRNGVLTVVGAQLQGGKRHGYAIRNDAHLHLRDITTTGYGKLLEESQMLGKRRQYLSSYPAEVPWQLPVAEPPVVGWDPLETWANPIRFGANGSDSLDDTPAIQAAIDAGYPTIYFPAGNTFLIEDTLFIRGNVHRLIGCEGRIGGKGVIVLEEGNGETVVVERLFFVWGSHITLIHRAGRPLIWSSITGPSKVVSTGSGDFFLEDVVANTFRFLNPKQRIFARQLDTEERAITNIINDGASLWILGYKTERASTKIATLNGGTTEVIGGHLYGNLKPGRTPPDDIIHPVFWVENGHLSLTQVRYFTSTGHHHRDAVWAGKNGKIDTLYMGILPPDGEKVLNWQTDGPAGIGEKE